MIATALSYQSNQYCNRCFNERADSTQKQNLNTFEFMGESIELKNNNMKNQTPKEKANYLVALFEGIAHPTINCDKLFAKECA
ncbi:hypothetical protein M3M33_14080, partial [Loigolactobacillus coryniformis]|uniref:hypothetical protein n=1 Tax=Loigolactobacillus coryniformis TaxID=1610 RepID=UPI00201AB5A7